VCGQGDGIVPGTCEQRNESSVSITSGEVRRLYYRFDVILSMRKMWFCSLGLDAFVISVRKK
jgi:hypothetical protein